MLGIDDVDADDVPDLVASAPAGRLIRMYSGRTRASLRTISFGGATTSLAMLGDITGDGVREFVVGGPTFTSDTGRVARGTSRARSPGRRARPTRRASRARVR